jgi:hypothetical protein
MESKHATGAPEVPSFLLMPLVQHGFLLPLRIEPQFHLLATPAHRERRWPDTEIPNISGLDEVINRPECGDYVFCRSPGTDLVRPLNTRSRQADIQTDKAPLELGKDYRISALEFVGSREWGWTQR